MLCESVLWPASSPLQIKSVIPIIATEKTIKEDEVDNPILEWKSPLNFYTRPWPEPGLRPLSLYAMFWDFELPDDSDKAIESEYGISFVTRLPPMTVFKDEDILLLNLDPDTEKIVPEGFEAEYKSSLSPVGGYGNGMISGNSTNIDDFDVLDGYKIKAMPAIEWFEDPDWIDNANWSANPVAAAFSHIFIPTKGVGSYTLRCRFNFKLEESETKDSTKVAIENEVPVSAIPGLRILSPIEALCYPLNQTIKVTTTMDSKESNELWQKIKWKLNGEPFKPDTATAPFELELKHKGKWKLEAELETIDPVTGKKIVLYDSAEFDVVNIEIFLTPSKKVVNQLVQKTEQLKLSIIANGNEAVKPETPFIWQRKEFHAVVDPIEWQKLVIPNDSISVKLDPQSFLLDCDLKDAGAATFLATVTIRIIDAKKLFDQKHKGFKDEYEEPVFTFPVTRADLWAVQMSEITNIENHFPEKSIAKAYRTYHVKSFDFEFNSNEKNKHSFSDKEGLKPEISLSPALPGISTVTASIDFKWQVSPEDIIAQNLVEPTKMVIKPSEPCDYKVEAQPILDFGSSWLKMGKITTSANAVDLFSLIETRVEPASFTINVGETKTLNYVAISLENSISAPENGSGSHSLYLLNKSFALDIENVEWTYSQDSQPSPVKNSIEGNPFDFSRKEAGQGTGKAIGILSLQEVMEGAKLVKIPDAKIWTWQVNKPTLLITMIDSEGNEITVPDKVALSSLGVTTKFKAFYSNEIEDEFQPVAVQWELTDGDVKEEQPIRRGILTELNANIGDTYKIGVFSCNNATCSKVIDTSINLVSYLSGDIKLQAKLNVELCKIVKINLMQPSFKIIVWPVGEKTVPLFETWASATKLVWTKEGILELESIELAEPIPNIIAPNPPLEPIQIPTAEEFLLNTFGENVSFMNPILFDDLLNLNFGTNGIMPRQPFQLFSQKRKDDAVNVYAVDVVRKYENGFGFSALGGFAVDSEIPYFNFDNQQLIDDSLKSGIAIRNFQTVTPQIIRYFPHEIGHILIRYKSEHLIDGVSENVPENNVMTGDPEGSGLEVDPRQFIKILNLDKSKPASTILIREK